MKAIPSIDHLGNEYPSAKAMMDAYGLNRATFLSRIEAGESLEQALRPAKDKSCYDHTGKKFPSRKAMAQAWGLPPNILKNRLENEWDLKTALETPAKKDPVKDHLGHEFPNQTNMARAWHINVCMLRNRLAKGWTLKDALETPSRQIPGGRVKDHTGRPFVNTQAMLDAWGISKGVYKKRIRSGMTLKETLETPVPEAIQAIPQKDHNGTEFESIAAMCDHYGISRDVYTGRLEAGWSLKDTLCTPIKEKALIQDWDGRIYDSIVEMAKTIHVSKNFISYRWMGFTGADNAAARACTLHWPGTDAKQYRIRECISFPWFLCEDMNGDPEIPHANEIVLHADKIIALKSSQGE